MATTARRRTTITYSGDVDGEEILDAANNVVSPGMVELKALVAGDNTIDVPVIGTAVPTACTIVPASGNTVAFTLKGAGGDTGIQLHNTDPTTLALDPSVGNFTLHLASETALTVRLFWS